MRTPPNERLTPGSAEVSLPRKTGSAGSRPEKDAPERRCVLSGTSGERGELIRLALSPNGLVLPDVQSKAPGRGAWIGATRGELEAALDAGKLRAALARAFKTGELEIPRDLPEKIEVALTRGLLDRLGLEMRIGALLTGSQRIADAARSGGVALLLHASDASDDGCSKLDQAWRVGLDREGSGLRGWRLPLDRTALSVALGRDNTVHLALADDASAKRVIKPLLRLLHFTGHEMPEFERGVPVAARTMDEREIDSKD